METLLFVLLATALSVQDDAAERVQLSKIKDIEKAKSNIKRVAPPYINFETCGDYLIIASQSSPDAVKMAYYEGKEIKEGEVVRYSAFRRLVVEIDDSLKAPEILLRAVAPPKPVFYYRMSQKDYATMPCLPKGEIPSRMVENQRRPPLSQLLDRV